MVANLKERIRRPQALNKNPASNDAGFLILLLLNAVLNSDKNVQE